MTLCAASENTGNILAEFWVCVFFLTANFLFSRNITNVCDALLLTGLLDTLLAHEWTVGGIFWLEKGALTAGFHVKSA